MSIYSQSSAPYRLFPIVQTERLTLVEVGYAFSQLKLPSMVCTLVTLPLLSVSTDSTKPMCSLPPVPGLLTVEVVKRSPFLGT